MLSYRDLNDPTRIIFTGKDADDDLSNVTGKWVMAKQTLVHFEEKLDVITVSDLIENDEGPWYTNWPEYPNDCRQYLHTPTFDDANLTQVPVGT